MTSPKDLAERRAEEAERIAIALARQKGERRSQIKGGEGTVAWVTENLCIGCDQCTIVCDDDAIDLYFKDVASPLINVPSNKRQGLSEMHVLAVDYAFWLAQQMQ